MFRSKWVLFVHIKKIFWSIFQNETVLKTLFASKYNINICSTERWIISGKTQVPTITDTNLLESELLLNPVQTVSKTKTTSWINYFCTFALMHATYNFSFVSLYTVVMRISERFVVLLTRSQFRAHDSSGFCAKAT